MSKRRFNPSEEEKIPIVEKLYRSRSTTLVLPRSILGKNQPSFNAAGGFMDDDDEYEERREKISQSRQQRADAKFANQECPDTCIKCKRPMFDSWLWERYSHPDCDLDLRKPVLRYWAKKNPHNPRYGDMKLYLKCQVVERMLEIYGSWEEFEAEKKLRATQKETRAEKNFEKKKKKEGQGNEAACLGELSLRSIQIRGLSGVKIEETAAHDHTYGEEEYDEDKDEYSKQCTQCDYVLRYEKCKY
ncbi:DNA repair protein [Cooperia oncophora]